MSILVNYYSANRPDAPDGHELEVLGTQVGPGEIVGDGANGAIKDVDMLVTIRGITASWVKIGAPAVADLCEKVEAGEPIVRFLPAGQAVYCDAASASATDVAILGNIETGIDDLNTAIDGLVSLMSTPATDLPHTAPDKVRDLSRILVGFNGTADQDVIAAVTGQTTRVHKAWLSFGGACTFSIYSNGSGGALLFAQDIPAAGIVSLDFDPRPWAITGTNEKLTLKTSAAVAVKGFVDYLRSA